MNTNEDLDPKDSSSRDALLESQESRERAMNSGISRLWTYAASLILTVFLLTILSIVINLSARRNSPTSPDEHFQWDSTQHFAAPMLGKSCNFSTSAEARGAGCVFDVLTTAWVPDECADLDLTDEYLSTVSTLPHWPFYHDEAGTREWRDLDLLKSGEWDGLLWVTRRAHRLHCTFAWQRVHQALLGGKYADTVMLSPHHTEHCKRLIGEESDASADGKVGAHQTVHGREC